MARRRLGAAKAKLKKVPYRFIEPDTDEGRPLYAVLRDLVTTKPRHRELDRVHARIALAWNVSWTPDVDGRETLGRCHKVSDLHREVSDIDAYDFVVILQQDFWTRMWVTDLHRRALLDHELCHATVVLDKHGDPVIDERGRTVFRIRKHDVEEFACILEDYGCWKGDLVVANEAIKRAEQRTSAHWIGFTSLQAELAKAGKPGIPLHVVMGWTEDQRREAATWAILKNDLPERFQDPANVLPPMFVIEAARASEAA